MELFGQTAYQNGSSYTDGAENSFTGELESCCWVRLLTQISNEQDNLNYLLKHQMNKTISIGYLFHNHFQLMYFSLGE